jgi:hypothetical protein
MARRLLVLTTALFALCAPSASAATICVPFGTDCDGGSYLSLQNAIDAAAALAGRDTIRINAGYPLTENALVGSANVVDIVGSGQGPDGTVLTSASSDPALEIESPGSTVSNMRVVVEQHTMFETGLELDGEGVVADGVTVVGVLGVDNVRGVQLRTGAILRNSVVEVPASSNANYAIGAGDGTVIDNVSAAGDAMISAQDGPSPVVVRRLRSSSASRNGLLVRGNASVQISDSLIRLSGGSSSFGLAAESSAGSSPSIVGRHVTVVGTGNPANAGVGASAGSFAAGQTATVDVRDSIFHALSTDLEVESTAGVARIPTSHSNYDPAKVVDTTSGDAAVIRGACNLLVNPGFVDGTAANFRLRADSSLIDRGFAGAGSSADLDGQPRPNDGDGDGVAVRDIGAFEFQRAATPPPGPAADMAAPQFRILSRRLKLDRRGRVALVLRGPANETAPSGAAARLRSARRLRAGRARRRIRLGRKSFSLQPTARRVVRMKLSGKNARRVRRMHELRVVLAVTVRDAAGNSRTASKRVMLRAVRARR